MSLFKSIKESLEKLNTDIIESVSEPDEGKPFANEFSCRLNPPNKYDKFARKNCFKKHAGKCIDFIFGIKGGKSEVQTMRYKKSIWDESSARNHCKNHGGNFEA